MRKKILFLAALISTGVIIYSCGGGGGGSSSGGSSGTGRTAFFVTDDPANDFDVTIQVTGFELIGTKASCMVNLSTPVLVDLTESGTQGFLELVAEADCPASNYNRLIIMLSPTVTVRQDDTSQQCTLTSFTQGNSNELRQVQCDQSGCSIELNGAVDVVASERNDMVFDFVLKDSDVANFPNSNCTVTFKVSPINASEKEQEGFSEEVEGKISDTTLDTTNHKFTLTEGDESFLVDYSSIFNTNSQIGINDLLTLAENNNLEVKVKCSELDMVNNKCTASEISVEVKGNIQSVNQSNNTFVLKFDGTTITIETTMATEIEGAINTGEKAEVELIDATTIGATPVFIASEVEVESE